jgi:hypothetical protein
MRKKLPVVAPEDAPIDEFTEEEIEQANVGSLFAIQGPEFENVEWSIHRYRTRQEMAGDPSGEKMEWVADELGELKGGEIVARIGGGTFRFYGYIPRSDGSGRKRLAYNRLIALAGPRCDFGYTTPAPVTANASPPGSQGDALLIQLIQRMDQRLDRLERVAAVPAEKTSAVEMLNGMLTGMATMDAMRARNAPPPPMDDREAVKTAFEMFRQGIEVGQTRDPVAAGEAGVDWSKVLEVTMPAIERILTTMGRRRQPPPAPPNGGAARPPSSAEVIDEPRPAPAAEQKPTGATPEHRWSTAIESLYRAMLNGRDPSDFAGTLEDILDPTEVQQLRDATDPQVMEFLKPAIDTQYPTLAGPQGQVYLRSVLAALRTPADASE